MDLCLTGSQHPNANPDANYLIVAGAVWVGWLNKAYLRTCGGAEHFQLVLQFGLLFSTQISDKLHLQFGNPQEIHKLNDISKASNSPAPLLGANPFPVPL